MPADQRQPDLVVRRVEEGRPLTVIFKVKVPHSLEKAQWTGLAEGLDTALRWDLLGEAPLHLYIYPPPIDDAQSLENDWRVLEKGLADVFVRKGRKLLRHLRAGQGTLFDADTLEPHQ